MADNLENFKAWMRKQTIHLGRASEVKKERFIEEAVRQIGLSSQKQQTSSPSIPVALEGKIAVSPEYAARQTQHKQGITMMTKEKSMEGDPDCGQHDQLDKL